MVWILQVLVSIIFFVNKVLVLKGKKSGWLVGAIAATLAVAYFILIELYVYTGLEFGLIILMGYGFVKNDEQRNPQVELSIQGFTVILMLGLTYFAFAGQLTIVELFSSLGLLVGTYLMTHGRLSTGWAICAVAHALAAYLGIHKDQHIFAGFQSASVIVSTWGAMKKQP